MTPPAEWDLYSTVLHELGHGLGLGHGLPSSVMSSTLAPGTQRRALTEDDLAGLRALYGEPDFAYRMTAPGAARD